MLQSLFAGLFSREKKPAAPAPGGDPELDRVRALIAKRDWSAAAIAAAEVVAAQPERVDAILLEAKVFRARGLLEDAKRAFRKALVLEPRRAEAWLDLGVCHYLGGEHFWARVYFRFANVLDPDNAQIWNEFGLVEITLGNHEKAEDSLGNAVNRDPALPEAWNNLGLVLARRGDRQNARRHFLRATFLRPDYYMAQCNLGLACRDLELLEEAEAALKRAIEIDPAGATAKLNLAAVLQDLDRLDEALALLESASSATPCDANTLAALSALWLRRGDAPRAAGFATRALAEESGNTEARLALAHAQLAAGNFEEGWRNYEARLLGPGSPARRFVLREWRGEPLEGAAVLAYGEQGLGDEIMFASCLPDLAAGTAHCALECNPRLRALFRRSFPGVEFAEDAEPLERQVESGERRFDFGVALGSLPLFYRRRLESFPLHAGYLLADASHAAAWRERLDRLGDGLKVGLAWQGGLPRTGRVSRTLRLEQLLPVLRVRGVRWVNLQHAGHAQERAALREAAGVEIASWDEALGDIDETAALMSSLDLVVTVCSTVAHLGGALGKPTWVLTPRGPAWRYMLAGEGMPWYPAVKLFRQAEAGRWEGVIGRIAGDLEIAARRAGHPVAPV